MTYVESQIYNLASESLETKRIPDPYFYHLNSQGKLALSYTGEVIEDHIETQTYLGKAEYEGLRNLQEWCRNSEEGTAVWISPSYWGTYSETKIIVSDIVGTGTAKLLFNRAIVLDKLSAKNTLLFAKELGGKHFTSEELRRYPIPLGKNIDWLGILSRFIDTSKIENYIESGDDIAQKNRAIEIAKTLIIEPSGYLNPRFKDFYGTKPLRCDKRTSAFPTLFGNSELIETTFDCPRCKGKIPSGLGITTCPHCGMKKENAGEVCD